MCFGAVKSLRRTSPNVADKEKYLRRADESQRAVLWAAECPHECEGRAAFPAPPPLERLIWLLTRCTHNISLKKPLKCHLGLLEGQFVQFTL